MISNSADKKIAKLELLGIGSAKNREFKANLEEALRQLQLDIPIAEVRDINALLRYDISGIPALVVNGRVVFQRVVPSVEDIKIVLKVLLQKEKAAQQPVRRVVVPIDFSETAENAFRYALDMVEVLNVPVKVIHVHNASDLGQSLRLEEATPDESSYKVRLMKALQERYLTGDKKGPSGVTTEIIEGNVVEEICRLSEEEGTLIIMGTTGEGGLLGRWFGSISAQAARRAKSPVLLVPRAVRFKGLGRMVYASNYHPTEEKVLPQLISFANPFGATVCFAHIEENELIPYHVRTDSSGRVFHENGLTFQLTTIESQHVVEGLSRFTKEVEAEMLVMSTTRRNFIEELFHKSATRKMIFNTRIPLMILHF